MNAIAYERVEFRGVTLNRRTVAMLRTVEHALGYQLHIYQGSYNKGGVKASAGTHDGGGALDVWGRTFDDAHEVVREMRKVGFAAWLRTPSEGPWGYHIHAIAIGDKEMSSGAREQVTQYRHHENGLANHGPDDGPRVRHRVFTQDITRKHIGSAKRPAAVDLSNMEHEFSHPRAAYKKAHPGVRHIQHGLNKELGLELLVDGIAGPRTRAAYKKWQQHLGYTGKAADGVPGRGSLSTLGRKTRFRVVP